MKSVKKRVLVAVIAVIFVGCLKHKQNKGLVTPESKETTVDFITAKTLVVIPLELEGESKNFVLDTGDDLTTISRKEFKGRVTKISTATGAKTKTGNETVKSIRIADMEFQKIKARNLDLSEIGKDVPLYGGLLGQAVLSKANWLIDYPNKKLTVSNSVINTDGFKTIPIQNIRDPYLYFDYEGVTYKAFVDLGSTTALSVVESSKLGQMLLKKYTFKEESKTTTTAGGTATTIIKRGVVSNFTISGLEFNSLNTVLGKSSSKEIRIGMEFFKDFKLYLDYDNGAYKIK